MNIVKWEPFSELTTFRERLDRWLNQAAVEAETRAKGLEADEADSADESDGGARRPKP